MVGKQGRASRKSMCRSNEGTSGKLPVREHLGAGIIFPHICVQGVKLLESS